MVRRETRLLKVLLQTVAYYYYAAHLRNLTHCSVEFLPGRQIAEPDLQCCKMEIPAHSSGGIRPMLLSTMPAT
jgi:hypothetical protein